ncbi:MAG TPA: FTR1 family protein [Anaerolineales bacterium]|nr:FTR1 family protein [Anaerolineales bacterium]
MITGSLITIREGLEAFLIIGILLGYLTKINQPQLKLHVWIGAGAALLVSILLAAVFQTLAIQFDGETAQLFEAGIALLAVAVLITCCSSVEKFFLARVAASPAGEVMSIYSCSCLWRGLLCRRS